MGSTENIILLITCRIFRTAQNGLADEGLLVGLEYGLLLKNDGSRVVFFEGIVWDPLVEVLFVSKEI